LYYSREIDCKRAGSAGELFNGMFRDPARGGVLESENPEAARKLM